MEHVFSARWYKGVSLEVPRIPRFLITSLPSLYTLYIRSSFVDSGKGKTASSRTRRLCCPPPCPRRATANERNAEHLLFECPDLRL